MEALHDYLQQLGDPNQRSAQFYARADNLRVWLGEVETRLGSLSQRLSASVGKRQLDTSLAGDSAARQSTQTRDDVELKTPWTELDDEQLKLTGVLLTQDGTSRLEATADGPPHDAERIGREVAAKLIEAGGDALLEEE